MLGRPPYKWTPEIEAEICTRLAEGESLAAICRDGHMPSISVVYRRILDDETFRADYSRAREDQADTDADRIGEIASQVAQGLLDPQAARVAIDAYKWTAGKRKPKVYGDKLAIGGADDLPPIASTIDASKLSAAALRELMNAKPDDPDA